MIAIIDYQAGNLTSVQLALESLGAVGEITADPARLHAADEQVAVATLAEGVRFMTRLIEEACA